MKYRIVKVYKGAKPHYLVQSHGEHFWSRWGTWRGTSYAEMGRPLREGNHDSLESARGTLQSLKAARRPRGKTQSEIVHEEKE